MIRTNVCIVKIRILHIDQTIHHDDRDPCIPCFLQDIGPAVLHDGRKNDHVHPIGYKRPDGGDLVFLLLHTVIHDQADAVFRGGFFHTGGIAEPPGAFTAQLGKPDHKTRGLGTAFGSRFFGFAASAGQEAEQQACI